MTTIALHTNLGTIHLELDAEKAPLTVENFLAYVDNGHYNDTIFHRIIAGFMVQGGGMTADMTQKETLAPIQNEAKNGLKNEIGTIAMARTNDPHSATAQFFINIADNSFLDHPGQDGWGYCVFGRVSEGLDIVQSMAGVKTGSRGFHQDVPAEDITIERAERID